MSQAPMSPDVTSDDKLWAALSYIPFIWPIPAVVVFFMEDKKNRPYIKFNAVQAIVMGVIAWVTSFLCIGILVGIYMLYLAYLAYQGQEVKVPVVTDFIRNQGWA
ncbi:MAG TPA: hypothetical protein PKE35_06410 [Anaerolineales bacterium]|nr:hypothetical protein [Anaerolineales bacterium]HNJ15160.1 hypothetical protein [Anaerolineales bacterium]